MKTIDEVKAHCRYVGEGIEKMVVIWKRKLTNTGETTMVKTLFAMLCVGIISLSAFADLVIDSFCGYNFGSLYVSDSRDRSCSDRIFHTENLSKPFRHFTKATLIYGKGSRKLQHINISFTIPADWSHDMFRAELNTVKQILSEKYGVRLSNPMLFPDGYNYNNVSSDPYYSESDTSYIQAGMPYLNQDVQGRDFSIEFFVRRSKAMLSDALKMA